MLINNHLKMSTKKNSQKRTDLFFKATPALLKAIEADAKRHFEGNVSMTIRKRLATIYNVKI